MSQVSECPEICNAPKAPLVLKGSLGALCKK